MQIPLSYADAVIGTSGTNISYIRTSSGATIAIQETRGVPDEINGSASQDDLKSESFLSFSRSFSLEIVTLWYLN